MRETRSAKPEPRGLLMISSPPKGFLRKRAGSGPAIEPPPNRSPIMAGAAEETFSAPAAEAWPKLVEGGVAAAFGCSAPGGCAPGWAGGAPGWPGTAGAPGMVGRMPGAALGGAGQGGGGQVL